ncbi:MAG: hypothetical protein ABIZ81_01065 [Opitutaceae bacterium]
MKIEELCTASKRARSRRFLRSLIIIGALTGVLGLRKIAGEEAPKMTRTTWRYAEAPGFEILSDQPDEVTQQWVAGLQRQIQLFTYFFGADFLTPTDVPVQILLYRSETDALRGPSMPGRNADPRAIVARGKIVGFEWGSDRRWGGFPRLADDDALMISQNLWDQQVMGNFMALTGGGKQAGGSAFRVFARHLVQYRTPPLPRWISIALDEWWNSAYFTWTGVQWSDTSTQLAAKVPVTADLLLPMKELFESGPSTGIEFEQARLFFVWGLFDDQGAHRAAFMKFVKRSTGEPITEKLFQECFGITFEEMRGQLTTQLNTAQRKRLHLQADGVPDPAPISFRDATVQEFARISGEATRLYAKHPMRPAPAGEAPDYYIAQARETLMRGYESGDRDPRLLASLGLCEYDAGQPEKGRPRVYLELARLRQGEALADPKGAEGKLASSQVSFVLEPLAIGRRQTPRFPHAYQIIADTWLAGAVPPTKAELAALEEGMSLYPRDSDLGFKTAQLYLRSGLTAEARHTTERCLSLGPRAEIAAQLEKLKADLGSSR